MSRVRRRSFLGFVPLLAIISCHSAVAFSSIRKQVDEDKPTAPVVPIPSPNNAPAARHRLHESASGAEDDDVDHDHIDLKPPTQSPPGLQPGDVALPIDAAAVAPDQPSILKRPPANTPVQTQNEAIQQDFLHWCTAVGIHTNLTIQIFDYQDFRQIHTNQKNHADLNDDDDNTPSSSSSRKVAIVDPPLLQVRGLAATRDIQKGEVVIVIPFSAMITVTTTIDGDPILNKVMGPAVRSQHDWEDEFYELALLTVAILYHRNLKKASPLYHYITILETSPTDNIPFLWTKTRLQQEAPEGVRRHARGIYKDIQEAYDAVVLVLKREYPDLFETETYSLHNFMWAFALVNSRHWHLPIPGQRKGPKDLENRAPLSTEGVGDQLPPASLPTDEWMAKRGDVGSVVPVEAHSFLAPVADLLNFGPPCTRGSYNSKTQAFELVATCFFLKGQEVTYWYSDDCDDIVIANYGFTHPMVPACPTTEELRQEVELWKRRANNFETEIELAYVDLEVLERELAHAHDALASCNCDDSFQGQHKGTGKSRKGKTAIDKHDHIRGSNQPPDYERHGIRRKAWNHQKSDMGL